MGVPPAVAEAMAAAAALSAAPQAGPQAMHMVELQAQLERKDREMQASQAVNKVLESQLTAIVDVMSRSQTESSQRFEAIESRNRGLAEQIAKRGELTSAATRVAELEVELAEQREVSQRAAAHGRELESKASAAEAAKLELQQKLNTLTEAMLIATRRYLTAEAQLAEPKEQGQDPPGVMVGMSSEALAAQVEALEASLATQQEVLGTQIEELEGRLAAQQEAAITQTAELEACLARSRAECQSLAEARLTATARSEEASVTCQAHVAHIAELEARLAQAHEADAARIAEVEARLAHVGEGDEEAAARIAKLEALLRQTGETHQSELETMREVQQLALNEALEKAANDRQRQMQASEARRQWFDDQLALLRERRDEEVEALRARLTQLEANTAETELQQLAEAQRRSQEDAAREASQARQVEVQEALQRRLEASEARSAELQENLWLQQEAAAAAEQARKEAPVAARIEAPQESGYSLRGLFQQMRRSASTSSYLAAPLAWTRRDAAAQTDEQQEAAISTPEEGASSESPAAGAARFEEPELPASRRRLSFPVWKGAYLSFGKEGPPSAAAGKESREGTEDGVPAPPSSDSWDWPMSRPEKRERFNFVDRQMLMADQRALMEQLQSFHAECARHGLGEVASACSGPWECPP